jgi:hypothetical protein
MRVVLTAFVLLAAAGLVDTIWFDGSYRTDVVNQAIYQGNKLTLLADDLIRKVISP